MSPSESKGVALITGSSQGIGRAIALRLAQDGFDIVLNDLPVQKEALEAVSNEITTLGLGRKTFIAICDVSAEEAVEKMVDDAVKALGSLDVMVANAGIAMGKSILSTSASDWDRVFAINARGIFLCYKYAGKQMIKQGKGGRIIGASSFTGKQALPLASAYSSSKFAVRGLTQSAAQEFAQYDITVNAYAPGIISQTGMSQSASADPGLAATVEAFLGRVSGPLATKGTPVEIASIVSYLASAEAHYITGQTISVNGGAFFD
uniref:Acetoin reductase family protein n=1 Tax=Moniliophthora roreri TaxID=221103 RepID=A0A0W0GD85_MONRR